jgi:hypothetical protein
MKEVLNPGTYQVLCPGKKLQTQFINVKKAAAYWVQNFIQG